MTAKTSSHKYLLRIGSIAAYWSVTELMCDQALAALLAIDPDLARSINPPTMTFEDRLEVLRSVSGRQIKDDRLRAEFLSILEKLENASCERNNVVHSVWFNLGYEDLVDTRYSFERGDLPITRSVKYTPEKLEKVLEQVKEATEELTGFLLKRLGVPATTATLRIEVS